MAADMFNGWGVRALSENERRYDPIGYHLGTVWRTITRSISTGFRRYGFAERTLSHFHRIGISLLHSASNLGSASDSQGMAIRGVI